MYLRWRGQFVVPANKKKAVIYVSNIESAIAAITGASNTLQMGVIEVSAITAAGAKLSWASSGDGVKYKSSTDNVNWGDDINATSLTLTGLAAATTYTYYIKAFKTGMRDSVASVASFKTATSE
jgi:hypothetical protein